jgi:ribonuclease HI
LLDAVGTLVREAYRFLGSATNNIAELTAIEMVYDHLPDGAGVIVHTDSKYSIGVLTLNWKAKANIELIARIKRTIAGRPTLMKYVPGHSGVPLNERADELAREAIAMRRSSG